MPWTFVLSLPLKQLLCGNVCLSIVWFRIYQKLIFFLILTSEITYTPSRLTHHKFIMAFRALISLAKIKTRRSGKNCSLTFLWYDTDRMERVQQFYVCACIRCRGDVFTEPLPSNDKRIQMETHRLMGGIYELRRWDGLRCRNIHTEFHKDWFKHSKVNSGGYTDTQTAMWSHKPTLF
jgi:hypothetical protein